MSSKKPREVGRAKVEETQAPLPGLLNILFGQGFDIQGRGGATDASVTSRLQSSLGQGKSLFGGLQDVSQFFQGQQGAAGPPGGLFGQILGNLDTSLPDLGGFLGLGERSQGLLGQGIEQALNPVSRGGTSADFFGNLLGQGFTPPSVGFGEETFTPETFNAPLVEARGRRISDIANQRQSAFIGRNRRSFGSSGVNEQSALNLGEFTRALGDIDLQEQENVSRRNLAGLAGVQGRNLQRGNILGGFQQGFRGQQIGAASILPGLEALADPQPNFQQAFQLSNLGREIGLQGALFPFNLQRQRTQDLSQLAAQIAGIGTKNQGNFPIINQPSSFGRDLLGIGAGLGGAALGAGKLGK